MAMLNVRVPTDTEEELEAIALARGSTKSDIAREAIAAFLNGHEYKARGTLPPGDEEDDFAEFGDEVRHTNRKVLQSMARSSMRNGRRSLSQPTSSSRRGSSSKHRSMGCRDCRIGIPMLPISLRRSALRLRTITTGPCPLMS